MHTPKPIRLCLPSPPSLNSLIRATKTGHVYKVPAARAYEKMIADDFGHLNPIPGDFDVMVEGAWYRPRKTGDLDNTWKLVGDCLQGIAYENDSQITRLHLTRHDDKRNPRLELVITALERPA